jgi:hypothetical protein
MAVVPIVPVAVPSASIVLPSAAANAGTYNTGGHTFINTTSSVLIVVNGGVGAAVMTTTWLRDGVAVTRTQSIAAGATRLFHFSPQEYGATVNIAFDVITSVTVGVVYTT